MLIENEEELLGRVSQPAQPYVITSEDIENAISPKSPYYHEYVAGMCAINELDIEGVLQIAEAIRIKTLNLEEREVAKSHAYIKTGKDYLFSHSMNVSLLLAPFFCWWEGYSPEHSRDAIAGAITHDIGKLYVPKETLGKKGRLTPWERIEVMRHPALGYLKLQLLLKGNPHDHSLIPLMAYQHHENNDGTGYPDGIKKSLIAPEAKILHVADVYEAMIAERCYKCAETPTNATEFLVSQYGTMFSPTSTRKFIFKSPAYKEDDYVLLSDKRVARVIKNRQDAIMRPKIEIVETGEIIDLANDFKALNIIIEDKIKT